MEKQDIGFLQTQKLDVMLSTNPFGVGSHIYRPDLGKTISEILAESCPDLIRYRPYVFIGDYLIKPEYYHVIRPKAGQIISIKMNPMGGGGGKNPLRTLLSIAIMAAGAYFAGAFATNLALGMFGGGVATASQLAIAGGIIKLGVGVAGSLLVNAIAPPAKPKVSSNVSGNNSRDISQTYFIQGASNRLRPYDPVPSLLGTHRIVPPLGTQSYNEVVGDIVYVRQMFCFGFGKYIVEEEKIGDTLLSEFSEVTCENKFDGNLSDQSTIIPSIVTTTALNISIESKDDWSITQTTGQNTDEFEVQITYPSGLLVINDEGGKSTYAGDFTIRYAPTGTTEWIETTFSESRATNAGFVVARRFIPSERGQYDVQIKRVYDNAVSGRVSDEMVWSSLRSYQNESPVNETNISGKAVRIKGTDQLNGQIDQYNLVASRLIPEWDGSEWVADQVTTNPASIYLHLLRADEAREAIPDTEIDFTAIQTWHSFCVGKNLSYSSYIDYSADREDLIKEICAAGLATPVLKDNKYSVVIDTYRENYSGHISQRNSFNFSYEKVFSDIPHAFRVAFLNKDKDYLQDEIIIYRGDYTSQTATRIVRWDFPGVVDSQAIYTLARHRLAEMEHRPDMYQVTQDIEYMTLRKGDKIKFSHDVALIGLATGRIKEIVTSGSNITGIVVDEECPMESGLTYSINARLSDGDNLTVGIVTAAGSQTALTFSTAVPISQGLQVGDLFSFGETQSETIDALVHSVMPQNDEVATIRIVNYAPEIFESYEGTIPSYDNQISLSEEFTRPREPELVSLVSGLSAQIVNMDGSISSRMIINLTNNNTIPVDVIVKIREVGETSFREADVTTQSPTRIVLEGLEQGKSYDFFIYYRRVANNVTGVLQISPALEINGYEFVGTSEPPPDIENFNIIVRGESVYLEWDRVTVYDMDHYEIRYSSETTGATWGNAIPYAENIPKETTQISVPSAIGTYLIRAVDRQGDKSENAVSVVTNVNKLLGLNVVETIEEHLSWGGTFEGTTVDGGVLKLGSTSLIDDWAMIDDIADWNLGEGAIANTGYYYFENTYDLTEVYDNVLSAYFTISGENLTDEIDEWLEIDGRDDWDGASPDQYKVELQLRTTNDDPSGSPTWSDWKKFIVGEYTARAFQFRLLLVSLVSDITPNVSEFVVIIDMPDRDERGYVASSGTTTYSVTFTEAFKEAPIVVVSAGNMEGNEHVYGPFNVTSTGFDIEFHQGDHTLVDKSFFWHAKGYGRVT